MVDIHSHILWGLDDGAASVEDSVAMLKAAALGGTTDIVATPHSNSRYEYDGALVEARIAELAFLTEDAPRIHRGCDFHLSYENIAECLRFPSKYTINGHGYLLVEFSDLFIPPTIEEVFRQFQERGVTPIITHPERNNLLAQKHELVEGWVAQGCLSQVTAQSLTGRFGRTPESYAWELLEKGLAHFVASDAHDPEGRHPRLDEARGAVANRLSEDAAARFFTHNPGAVIAGKQLPEPSATSKPKKKWYQF
jgi:protein-tyrosine phosphatase